MNADDIVVQRRLDARTRTTLRAKTKSGVRRIDLDLATVQHLRNHEKRMEAEGWSTEPQQFVFVNAVGKPISATNL